MLRLMELTAKVSGSQVLRMRSISAVEVAKALQDEGLKTKIRQLGGEVETMSVDEFNGFIAKERAINADIVKLIGYQPH